MREPPNNAYLDSSVKRKVTQLIEASLDAEHARAVVGSDEGSAFVA